MKENLIMMMMIIQTKNKRSNVDPLKIVMISNKRVKLAKHMNKIILLIMIIIII